MLSQLSFQGIIPKLYHPAGDYPHGSAKATYPERMVYARGGRWYFYSPLRSHGENQRSFPSWNLAAQAFWDSIIDEGIPQDLSTHPDNKYRTSIVGVDGRGFVVQYKLDNNERITHILTLSDLSTYGL